MIDSLFYVGSVIAIAIIVIWDIMQRQTPLHGKSSGLLQFKLTDEQRAEEEEARASTEARRGRRSRKRR